MNDPKSSHPGAFLIESNEEVKRERNQFQELMQKREALIPGTALMDFMQDHAKKHVRYAKRLMVAHMTKQ